MTDGDWTRNITTTGQIGDGREAAAVEYVLKQARAGDVDDVLATIDRFAYEKSLLINVGDAKCALLDAAVRRADPKLALELGTYVGYGALRIARAAPAAKVYSVELAEANPANARQIWAHAGVADRVTCVVGTVGDGGHTLDALADEHGFTAGSLDFLFLDHDKDAYVADLQSILDRGWLHTGSVPGAEKSQGPGATKQPEKTGEKQKTTPALGGEIEVPWRLVAAEYCLTRARVRLSPDFAQRVHR